MSRTKLGARVRSNLGALTATRHYLEILTVPVGIFATENYVVTGTGFGATQGGGNLQLCDSTSGNGVCVEQTIVAWSDTSITFTCSLASSFESDSIVWVIVTSDEGLSDYKGTYISALTAVLSVSDYSIGFGAGQEVCGFDGGFSCVAFFDFITSLSDAGYLDDVLDPNADKYNNFFKNTPGFTLLGDTSAKELAISPYDSFVPETVTIGDADIYGFCGSGDGIAAYFGKFTLAASNPRFIIVYEEFMISTPCASDHGWSNGETVYMLIKHPVSIQITSDNTIQVETNIERSIADTTPIVAYAFDADSNITANILWAYHYGGSYGALPDTGASAVPTNFTVGTNRYVAARVTNKYGQYRQSVVSFSIKNFEITSITPAYGGVAGGNTVAIVGDGFTSNTSIEINGNPATDVTLVDMQNITCTTPAGSVAVVDVDAIDGSYTDTLSSAFTYEAFTLTSAVPTTIYTGGGDEVTITGTGFVAGATVTIDGNPATSVTVVNAHTITCIAPAGSAGAVDVAVTIGLDTETLVAELTYDSTPPVVITGVSPSSGTTAGGTAITISGTGFTADCTDIKLPPPFNTPTSIVFVNDTTITCVTPAGSAGATDLFVGDTVTGKSDILAGGYTYT
jgi:hypothetical protein